MTVLIELPGVLASTAGLERVITTLRGFPDAGLADLFLFDEGAGTGVTNKVLNRPSGLLEKLNPGDYGGEYAWLGGAGGLQLQGTQTVVLPDFDPTTPWSLVYLGGVTGVLSGATEAISALISFRDRVGADIRGPHLIARAFQAGGANGYYQTRAWQGAADGATANLLPSTAGVVGQRRVAILSYDGGTTVTASVYDKAGALVSTISVAATDAGMTTNGGVVKALAKPTIGISNTVYDGGIQQVEAFARYSHVLNAEDITRICKNGASLGAARGRAW